jgi:hypothetical protein
MTRTQTLVAETVARGGAVLLVVPSADVLAAILAPVLEALEAWGCRPVRSPTTGIVDCAPPFGRILVRDVGHAEPMGLAGYSVPVAWTPHGLDASEWASAVARALAPGGVVVS